MNARLFRSRDDRMVAGVAGGLAAYLNIDPSLVRILWVVLIPLTGGLILLLYLAMAIIVPEQPFGDDRWRAWEAQAGGWAPPPAEPPDAGDERWRASAAFTAGDPPESSSEPALTGGTEPTPATEAATSAFTPPPGATPESRPGTRPPDPTWTARPPWAPPPERHHDRTAPLVFGLILVFIGAVLLARTYLPGIDWGLTWPILFVGIGIALLVGSIRRSSTS